MPISMTRSENEEERRKTKETAEELLDVMLLWALALCQMTPGLRGRERTMLYESRERE